MVIVVDDADRENEGDFIMAAEKATPETMNFMVTHGRGIVCMPMTQQRLDELRIPLMVSKNNESHGTAFAVSIDIAGPDDDRDERVRPGRDGSGDRRSGSAPRGHPDAGPRLPADGAAGRRPQARRAHRGHRGSCTARRPVPGRRALRGPAPRRLDGAPAGAHARGRGARAQGDLDRRPDRVPPPPRAAGAADGRGADPHRARRVHRAHLRELRRRDGARGPRAGRGGRRRADPGARALRVPDGRRLRLDAVRLRRSAARGARADRQGGARRDPVHPWPRRAGDRPHAQAARLPSAGAGAGYGRGERRARVRGGPAGLRDRGADPRRPRRAIDAAAHQQPRETSRSRRVRAVDHRARAARDATDRGEHRLPAHQTGEARPPAREPRTGGRAIE